MVLPTHALKPVQDWSESGNNGGQFTLVADKVLRLYLVYHCTGGTQISHMELLTHALEPLQDTSKWDSKEGHFTQFRPYRDCNCIRAN
jgi:hypothetical protein